MDGLKPTEFSGTPVMFLVGWWDAKECSGSPEAEVSRLPRSAAALDIMAEAEVPSLPSSCVLPGPLSLTSVS